MKKLKLNIKNVGEILSRDQLKQVVGGGFGSGSGASGIHTCQATASGGQTVYSSAESWRPTAMASLQAWVDFWYAAGGNPSCRFDPVYEV